MGGKKVLLQEKDRRNERNLVSPKHRIAEKIGETKSKLPELIMGNYDAEQVFRGIHGSKIFE